MNVTHVEEIYEQHVRTLSRTDRMRLLARLAQDLADQDPTDRGPTRRDIMDLHGLGKEIWEGTDPDEYVRELRREWDRDQ